MSLAVAVLLSALTWGASAAEANSQTFLSIGSEQTFIVPVGVSSVHVLAVGGSGGATGSGIGTVPGGAAAEVSADLGVTPGETLYVEVAGNGVSDQQGGAGGFNGGGASGGGVAAGGGGASDIRLAARSLGLSPDPRLIVAAGGGGAAEGTGGAAGSDGAIGNAPGEGGGAGTSTSGGTHGDASCGAGADGGLGLGGDGGASTVQQQNGAGGGGGGLYGGGGGGAGCMSGGGGGGGGSSLVSPGGSLTLAPGGTPPQIQLTYTPASAVPAPAPPVKTPAPGIISSTKRARLSRAGAISFVLRSNENAKGSATATVNVPVGAKVLRFHTRRLTLRAGLQTKVKLKLSKGNARRARAALGRGRHLRAKITVRLTNAAGEASTRRFGLRLTR